MTPNQQKVIDALESGKYRKTEGKTCYYDGSDYCYCVWGVAAVELFDARPALRSWDNPAYALVNHNDTETYAVGYPSRVLAAALGEEKDQGEQVAEISDSYHTFDEVAAVLRARWA